MRISDMAAMMLKNRQFQKQNPALNQPNGSAPPAGHVNPFEDPYLNITGMSQSQSQKTVPVDDDVAEKLRNLIREDFTQRNGMCGTGRQADAQADIIKSYVATLPGEQRLSAIYSCEQIAFREAERLEAKIREQNPDWQYGQDFDASILDNDFDIRV